VNGALAVRHAGLGTEHDRGPSFVNPRTSDTPALSCWKTLGAEACGTADGLTSGASIPITEINPTSRPKDESSDSDNERKK